MPGSGLLDTQVNWIEWAHQLIATDDPNEVVVEFVGNYGLLGAQPEIADGTPQFYERWRWLHSSSRTYWRHAVRRSTGS